MIEIYYGENEALEKALGMKGPFWGRHYTFTHGGKVLTCIYEVFSPALCNWLGPQAPPGSE